MKNEYDIIYISESCLQRKIIDYLIENVYTSSRYLIIEKRNSYFDLGPHGMINIDFNNFKGIVTSITKVSSFPKLFCTKLVGTHFTGVNCRFFETMIEYKFLNLIDDGIGTPIILNNPLFYNSFFKERIKLLITSIFLNILKGKRIKNTKSLIKEIDEYFSIYPLKGHILKEFHIDFLKKNYTIVDEVGFVGQPLVEYGMIKQIDYIQTLNKIAVNFSKKIKYYPDPAEKYIFNYKIDCIEIIKKNEPLETYLLRHGLPRVLITYTSSAVFNLRFANENFCAYYIKIPNSPKIREQYYSLFNKSGISLLELYF